MTRLVYQRRLAAGHYFVRLTEIRNRSWTVAAAGASLDQVDGRLPTRLDRDEALVDGLRQHEPGAAEHLVITYGDRAYRLAIRITGNRQDAEEVVQDAFWAVIRKIHPSGESAFGSWFFRIVANAVYQKLRSRQSQRRDLSWNEVLPAFDE